MRQSAAVRRQLDRTLTQAMAELGAHVGAIYLTDPNGEVAAAEVGVGVPLDYARPLLRLKLTSVTADPVVEAIRERHLVWISSGEDYTRRYPHPARVFPYPFTMAVAPMATGCTVWGAVVLVWPPDRASELSDYERHTIDTLGDRLGCLLRDAAQTGHRLLPEARSLPLDRHAPAGSSEHRGATDFITRLPGGCCSLGPDGTITFLDATAAELLGGGIQDLFGAKLWETAPWMDDPLYEHRHRDAMYSQQPTCFTARRPCGDCLLFQLYPDPTGVSVLITPAAHGHPRHDPVPVLTELPSGPIQLGAIHHLMHLAGALAEAVTVRDVVELVADRFLVAFQAQAFALLVAEDGRVRVLGHRRFDTALLSQVDRMPLTEDTPSVLGLTIGVPSFFASRQEFTRAYPDRAGLDKDMAAWAFLPLIASGQPVGVCVLAYDRPHPFSAEERITLTSFSALIAQALDRARLYDAEHRLARGLQASLLPRNVPKIPGLEVAARYLPAHQGMDIGGDFYDLIRLGAGQAAAVIGDVQGHNVHAAGLMGQVRTAVHAYAVAGATPGEILARTNRLLTHLDSDLLTSCLYAHLDLAHRRAHLATAGHWPPLLRRPDLSTGFLPIRPGPLLGVDPSAAYPTTEVVLPPDTILVFYTDGLTEAPGIRHRCELTHLAPALSQTGRSLDDIADSLLLRAQPNGDLADDTALLLLRILPG
ncbi:GAF domain-containing SpoIIE family protein phosphatase [Streptomyces cynarae]|uniref:GAF domain-containing SpoIIE family protein phosphatase n=1 Tax=Streptomyces cynarae TaxID=2981134 RepID=UPI00406CCFB8